MFRFNTGKKHIATTILTAALLLSLTGCAEGAERNEKIIKEKPEIEYSDSDYEDENFDESDIIIENETVESRNSEIKPSESQAEPSVAESSQETQTDESFASSEETFSEAESSSEETTGAVEQETEASVTAFSTEAQTSAQTASAQPAGGQVTPLESVVMEQCYIDGENVIIRGRSQGGITPTDTLTGQDEHFYLLELEPYDDDVTDNRYTAACLKTEDISFELPLNAGTSSSRLYKKFIICIWDGGKYIPVSSPIYITNPETIAKNKDEYKEPLTKKGLLIELTQISDAFELGVSHVIVNIPFSSILGSGIEYTYEGETYSFNKEVVEAYDNTISMFSNKGMLVNAVILNSWNPATPDLFMPGVAQTSAANYYNFNAKTEAGYKDIKAIASFLADRYSGEDSNHGKVSNWIIGNEINNQLWNYMGPMDVRSYVAEYERCFRVFYTAIKSTCANDRVFFSTDYNWMHEANGSTKYNAKEVIDIFNELVREKGNIDWGLAYHPYSIPLTEPEFWDDWNTGLISWEETSPIVNFANLSVLTDYFQKDVMRDRSGNVRHIILSEEGFTSQSATRGKVEELQAAAFAYAYYIVDSNPYIDAFIMSRQIDAPSEVATSCAFGLWTTDQTEDVNIKPAMRKRIWPVFKAIDKANDTLEATDFAKEILGIENWSDIIPGFKWSSQERRR